MVLSKKKQCDYLEYFPLNSNKYLGSHTTTINICNKRRKYKTGGKK